MVYMEPIDRIDPLEPKLLAMLNEIADSGINCTGESKKDLLRAAEKAQYGYGQQISCEDLLRLTGWLACVSLYVAVQAGEIMGRIIEVSKKDETNAASNSVAVGEGNPETVPGVPPDSGVCGVADQQRDNETPWG